MKNLFTFCSAVLLTLSSTVFAQETTFSFVRKGETVPEGSSIVCADTVVNLALPGMYLIGYDTHLSLKNNSEDNAKAVVRIDAIENCSYVSICCGGDCVSVGNNPFVEKGANGNITVAPGALLNLECHTVDQMFSAPDEAKTYYAQFKLSAWTLGDEDDKTTIQVTIDGSKISASIEEVKTEKEVVIKGRTLFYNFTSDATRTLRIFNISGASVKTQSLEQASGSVSLQELQPGMYLYKVDGAANACGKFILK